MPSLPSSLASLVRLLALLALVATDQAAAAEPHIETPTSSELEEKMAPGASLTGRELYDRFLKNRRRLRTMRQEGRILSSDPAGNPQEARFWLYWKDYRDPDDDPVEGIYSKTLVKFTGPRDVRHTGYLYVHRSDRDDDQYMFSPSRMRTSRVKIVGQSVAGSDFSIDDFLIGLDDIEDADYRRLPDDVIAGTPVYVIEATMKPEANSQYTRNLSYLEKAHYVPLRTRYWDEAGVEAKELTSPHASIKEFDGMWVPTESTVRDLLEDTYSTMHIDTLEPNPALAEKMVSVATLESQP